MSRYIDADKLYELIRTNDYRLATINGSIDYGMFTIGIKQAIDEIPTTADVVEVVRCKDCENCLCINDRYMCKRNAIYNDNYKEFYGLCTAAKEHFCSYGERKDEE